MTNNKISTIISYCYGYVSYYMDGDFCGKAVYTCKKHRNEWMQSVKQRVGTRNHYRLTFIVSPNVRHTVSAIFGLSYFAADPHDLNTVPAQEATPDCSKHFDNDLFIGQ